jgi:tyrosine-protein kinase Etk/Wzc
MTVCAVIASGVLTLRTTPVYEAAATLRIEDKDPNIPEIVRTLSVGSAVVTEAEALKSRTVADGAAQMLALQLHITHPHGVPRGEVFQQVQLEHEAPAAGYEITRLPDGRFRVASRWGPPVTAIVDSGRPFSVAGARLLLAPGAVRHGPISFEITPFENAVDEVLGGLAISPPDRDAKILTVRYLHTDRDLAWRIPNAIVAQFLAHRREMQQAEARGTVEFLRRQLDSTSAQLAGAENALRAYRERELVVNPQAEASSEVNRLVTMESERGRLEAERAALAKLVADVDSQASHRRPEAPSPYRQLTAFPTLVRSQAATDIMQSLATADRDRAALLERRMPADPDVRALTDRTHELEGQLRSVIGAYLKGLTDQIATLDTGLSHFRGQLGAVPGRELEVTRLERKSKILEGIYTLLGTRLKEAEIRQAAQDPSVTLVDSATAPRYPVKPRRWLNLMAGLVGGFMLGIAAAFVREARDKAVHTRADVQIATGLPVLGLIPRIPGSRKQVALIAEEERHSRHHRRRHVHESVKYTLIAARLGARRSPESSRTESPGSERRSNRTRGVERMALSKPGSVVAEAYGILQTNIVFCRSDSPIKVLVFTSPLPHEGKTTSAINLALTLGQRGHPVLLLDGDLRRGVVHTVFDTSREPGLSDVLRGAVPFAGARASVEVGEGRTVHYLTAGRPVPNPSDLLGSAEMRTLLTELAQEYHAIIIDSPPTNLLTDAALLSTRADGVIVVARAGMTESGALAHAMEQLRHVRAPVLGVVLNDIDFKRDSAYDDGFRYYDYSRYAYSSASGAQRVP